MSNFPSAVPVPKISPSGWRLPHVYSTPSSSFSPNRATSLIPSASADASREKKPTFPDLTAATAYFPEGWIETPTTGVPSTEASPLAAKSEPAYSRTFPSDHPVATAASPSSGTKISATVTAHLGTFNVASIFPSDLLYTIACLSLPQLTTRFPPMARLSIPALTLVLWRLFLSTSSNFAKSSKAGPASFFLALAALRRAFDRAVHASFMAARSDLGILTDGSPPAAGADSGSTTAGFSASSGGGAGPTSFSSSTPSPSPSTRLLFRVSSSTTAGCAATRLLSSRAFSLAASLSIASRATTLTAASFWYSAWLSSLLVSSRARRASYSSRRRASYSDWIWPRRDGRDPAEGRRGGTADASWSSVRRETRSDSSRARFPDGSNGSRPPFSVILLRRRRREQIRPEGVTTGSVGGVSPEREHFSMVGG
mmetsp:Transcript_142/g.284  ORF Transcript_142/g.284 Transcript_142/m.284 type:complete len:426 (-) Transcript_142:43-1320(-)